ncbi:MAG: outer membrane beta-barrel protein [Prolixibacteraceae bacterium]|nr:outer membrane beta-barrel protein [Prolixibacteraceae bacterium]
MRKITVILSAILFILSFNSIKTSAQNTPEKRWNVAVGYSSFHKTIHDGAYEFESFFPRLGITTTYQINELFHIGLGLGYSPKYIIVEPEQTYKNDLSLFAWWLNTKFQLLPMLINNANSPFNLYLSGKAGRYYTHGQTSNSTSKNWHYGAYAGASFYFLKNFGIYGEIGYGNESIFESGLNWRF